MALPFTPSENGATIGTFTWPRPRLDAIAIGAIRCARVEQADIELVADVRPRHLANQIDVEAFGRGEALVDRDDQRGRVAQRDEADAQTLVGGHLNNSAAVITACATSAIFLFSFIAVLRSSA